MCKFRNKKETPPTRLIRVVIAVDYRNSCKNGKSNFLKKTLNIYRQSIILSSNSILAEMRFFFDLVIVSLRCCIDIKKF